jgi:hypothetical protein
MNERLALRWLPVVFLLSACNGVGSRTEEPTLKSAVRQDTTRQAVPEPVGPVTKDRWEQSASAYTFAGTYVAPYDSANPKVMRVTLPAETTQEDAQRAADIGRSHLGVDATVTVETPSGRIRATSPAGGGARTQR